jgi:hypothetical protein
MAGSNYDLVAYVLLFIGILMVVIPPIVPLAKEEKLPASRFATSVTLPVTLGLISLLIAQTIFMNRIYDEKFFLVAIGLVSATGIAMSLAVLSVSAIRMRWAAD